MSQAWKGHEKKTANLFGGKRHIRAGNFSESAPDVDMPEDSPFIIECKYRKELPKLVVDGLSQAESYDKTKIPILVMKQRSMRGEIVALKLSDFVALIDLLDVKFCVSGGLSKAIKEKDCNCEGGML